MSTIYEDRPRVATQNAVKADLNYLKAGQGRPVSFTYEPPPGVPWTYGELEAHKVEIHDARSPDGDDDFSLDTSGFQYIQHKSALSDFSEEAAIRSIYYPESEQVLLNATGAEKVVIFDHTLRDSEHGSRETASLREPVRRVHNDQTFISGPRRVRDHLPPEEAAERLNRRFAIINLWRPLAEIEQLPLALCDARSISPNDVIPGDLVYRDKVGETFSFTYNADHRWHYFPKLRPEEVLLLKIYDSRTDGTARLTAHTAFEDPSTEANPAPRRSIELRALVFWR